MEAEQSSLEQAVRASIAPVVALRQALESGGTGLAESMEQLWAAASFNSPAARVRLSAVGMLPGLKDALCSLADEVVAADEVLASRLEAEGFCFEAVPGALPLRRQMHLVNAGVLLQKMACGLCGCRGIGEAGDTELAIRLLSTNAAVINSGSLAYRLFSRAADSRGGPSPPRMPPHLLSAQAALETLTLNVKQPEVLSRLRATHLTPAKILDCVRRILWREMAGLGTNTEPDVLAVLFPIISPGTIYGPEVAAIKEDRQLRGAIIAYLEGQIRRFAEGGTGPADTAATGDATIIYEAACNALAALCIPALLHGIGERACSVEDFIPTLLACLDRLLEEPCNVELSAEGKMLRSQAVAIVVMVMHGAYLSLEPGSFMVVQCVQRAAAASIWALQHGQFEPAGPTPGGQRLLILIFPPSPVDGVGQLLAKLTCGGRHGVDFAVPGQMVEALKTCEGLLRMAAFLPDNMQLPGSSMVPVQILEHVCGFLDATASGVSRNGINSRGERTAAAMLVQTAVKCALRWPGASSPSGLQHTRERVVRSMLTLAGTVAASVICHPDIPGLASQAATVRRWQGTALAVLHAAASLESASCQWLYLGLNPLLTALLRWQPMRLAMLSSEGRLGTLEKSYYRLLLEMYDADRTGHVLVLVRIRALGQMTQWAEANCGLQSCGQDPDGLLLAIYKLTSLAIAGCGLEDLQAAASRLHSAFQSTQSSDHNDLAVIGRASFWRRLRAEVLDPLALALSATAEEEGRAKQLEVAVEAAEALATRACAHTGCTTILGASEAAMPRGKLCSSCRLVQYCGPHCQKADWPAHKVACRELASRRATGGPA